LKSCHQGGVRAAAATVYFPIWHQEIESVIVLKNNKGTDENRVRKLDYNIQFSRIFYERFINNENITLFSPDVVPGLYDSFGTDAFDALYVKYENDASIPKKVVKAQDLILDVLKERLETGRIYLMNVDHANSHSPFKDQVVMSNLCVSGDTKIKIKYPEAIYDDIGEIYDWKVYEEEIEIGDLDEYISSREIKVMSYKVSDNDPCEDVPQIEVLSYNTETNQQEWAPITAFAETSPKAKVMKITDEESGKSIVVTPEHKVFTKNRGYVMAKDLTETDELVIN
jgi:ribonucleotide reductase alpha subunit